MEILIFLSSGLFLGWSLGANDAANVFGTAVGTRMLRFGTAAAICSIFVILGAVFGGAGAAHGLGKLGAINALPGAFMVALASALTVYWMTKAGLPVSTTQAIVGAIVGWNLFSHSITDLGALRTIVLTWVACPFLGAGIAALLYALLRGFIRMRKPHMLRLDHYTRIGLILAGAFGAYSLGANNIANVVGVFIPASPFADTELAGFTFTAAQQLFLLGAVAIAAGVFTYSKRVMLTVGRNIMPVTPVAGLVIVVAHSLVLFLFASRGLHQFLESRGLPTIPLVPVSSSQAVVGAVIGIGLLKGGAGVRQVRWRIIGGIALGWVLTPLVAAVLCFLSLFALQNVFTQEVYQEVEYEISARVLTRLREQGFDSRELMGLATLQDERFVMGGRFQSALRDVGILPREREAAVLEAAELSPTHITAELLESLDKKPFALGQVEALATLEGRRFDHAWHLRQALELASPTWRPAAGATEESRATGTLERQFSAVLRHFAAG